MDIEWPSWGKCNDVWRCLQIFHISYWLKIHLISDSFYQIILFIQTPFEKHIDQVITHSKYYYYYQKMFVCMFFCLYPVLKFPSIPSKHVFPLHPNSKPRGSWMMLIRGWSISMTSWESKQWVFYCEWTLTFM